MEQNEKYSEKLNSLLASYQLHYQNLRSLHWNIQGSAFFELHAKYEELYTRAQEIVDELAERILSIDSTPLSRFSDYLKASQVEEIAITHDAEPGVAYILAAQENILAQEKELLDLSDDLEDEGTNALMSDLIREKEKTNWMFKAWLNK